MNEIILTENETLRLQALHQYKILDTICEAAFDELTRLAAQICGTPIALISLIDESRQWFKSKVGLDSESTSRDLAFCAHAILQPHETLIISDTLLDQRFATNPLVTSDPCIRFYAGAPLITPEGDALGTLCVIDHVPRQMNSEQLEALQALSRQVMAQMELKRNLYKLERITSNEHKQIEYLISALSHDLRTPLLATRGTLYAMLGGAFGSVSDTWRDVLEDCRQANEDLLKFVEALLNVSRYKTEVSKSLKCEIINWKSIFIKTILRSNSTRKQKSAIRYKIAPSLPIVYGDALEIQRVVQTILDNAVKLNNPDQEITLEVALFGVEKVKISVRYNGRGIATLDKESLFNSFIQGRGRNNIDKLGLYLCFQIVEAHKGTINMESTVENTTFWFTLPATLLKC
ncbi:GAF domain-containing sensor histidine kinase [Nostoc flagelliforme FACHB-838]|uniref:histidine kinase n=1 Tax=Nostoc flagelliforme FACHB-838 TaxID=2692904 RepID=A0ABR8DPT9_9NOSO|nr:GAF domain-containing sensor histidine kinase [Nostoc flagelliforme]MBD2531233.1 GAF domain-containing sensor histidine kinase [Nostoc flagelliforme FACHB-838]